MSSEFHGLIMEGGWKGRDKNECDKNECKMIRQFEKRFALTDRYLFILCITSF